MTDRALSRRQFLAISAAAGGSLALRWEPVQARSAHDDDDDQLLEATVADLQAMMATRRLNSRKLTRFYLQRIEELNPILGAVIETNPDVLRIARRRDEERRHGRVRGPLHGIPVIVKDNIATRDGMQTTAGSLALVGSRVAADAPIVASLRRAGAVIIGKANLSEWANFRGGGPGFPAINGWSGRGGFTRNPYRLDLDPCGSSSGSGAAAAANLCAVAVGTETDGSILCPSGEQSLVGIKPTLGLVAQRGIIPIAASQDTAGPMCRTVADAAALLNVLRTPFGDVAGQSLPADYTAFLDPGALNGARLAVDSRYVDGDLGVDPARLAVFQTAIDAVRAAGAVVEEVTSPDPRDPVDGRVPFDDEFTVLLFEFKVQIAAYLATVSNSPMSTLADLIQFNLDRCDAELRYFGQEVFEAAEATSGDLTDPEYLAAAQTNRTFGRNAIDSLLAQGFDAVITPSFSFGTSPAATGGYPSMAVPVGFTSDGGPVGFWMSASYLQEPKLVALGSAIEHLLQARRQPELAGAVPPEPPRFPGCPAAATAASRSIPKATAECACARPAR